MLLRLVTSQTEAICGNITGLYLWNAIETGKVVEVTLVFDSF